MNHSLLFPILRDIVGAEFPDEMPAFDFDADRRFREIIDSQGRVSSATTHSPHANHFAEEAKVVLESIAMVIGTASAIVQIRQAMRANSIEHSKLELIVRKQLSGAGVGAKRMERVSGRIIAG